VFTVMQRQMLAGANAADLPWATLLLCQAVFSLPLLLLFCLFVQPAATADSVAVLAAAEPWSSLVLWFGLSSVLGVALSLCVMHAVSRVTPLSLSVAGAGKNNVLALVSLAMSPLPSAQNLAGIALSIGTNALYVWSKA
jgi:hypothetical protein